MGTMSRLSEHMKRTEEAKKNRGKSRFGGGADGKKSSMWHFWKTGPQVVRFVDDYLVTKTHYIGNRGKMGAGLKMFPDDLFTGTGQDKTPVIIPCANWDVEKEERIDGGCVVCMLNQMSRSTIDSDQFEALDEPEQKFFQLLKSRSDNRTHYRWHLIDRADEEFKGFKITTVGQELFDALKLQVHDKIQPRSFADDQEGVDVCVEKTGDADKDERVKYTASMAVDQKTLSVKQSPLSTEERTWKKHDLKERCCRLPDQNKLLDSLNDDVRDMLVTWMEQNSKKLTKSTPAPKTEVPASKPVEASTPPPAATSEKKDFALNGGTASSSTTSGATEGAKKKRPF